jgi:hypothetical protein
VLLYRQGEVNFIVNAEPESFAQRFARLHGPCVCAIAFRVADAAAAYQRALELGAWGFDNKTGPMELNIPAIKGIGDSLIYFVDRWRGKKAGRRGRSATSASTTSTSCPEGCARRRRALRGPGARPDLYRPPDAQRHRGRMGSGPTSTSACSTSARSATSTSRASRPG